MGGGNIPIAQKILNYRKHRPTEQKPHIRIRARIVFIRIIDALSRCCLRGRHLPTANGAYVVLGIGEIKGEERIAGRGVGVGKEEVEVADVEAFGDVLRTVAAAEGG